MACGFGECWSKGVWAVLIGAVAGAAGFIAYTKHGHKLSARLPAKVAPATAGLAGGWGQPRRIGKRMWR